MGSTLSLTQSRFSAGGWVPEPFDDAPLQPTDLDQLQRTRPSLRKRASRVLVRFLMTFGIGVAATLAWQSYGNSAREMIANSSPQLVWLAPAAAIAPPPAATPAAPSADLDELKAISRGLAVVRQSVDQLAAGQQQITREITKLQAARQDNADRTLIPPQPAPTAPPARKPAPSQFQPIR